MTSLEQRVRAALGDSTGQSPWEQLIALFQADREAFYRVACEGMSSQAEGKLRELEGLRAQCALRCGRATKSSRRAVGRT